MSLYIMYKTYMFTHFFPGAVKCYTAKHDAGPRVRIVPGVCGPSCPSHGIYYSPGTMHDHAIRLTLFVHDCSFLSNFVSYNKLRILSYYLIL